MVRLGGIHNVEVLILWEGGNYYTLMSIKDPKTKLIEKD